MAASMTLEAKIVQKDEFTLVLPQMLQPQLYLEFWAFCLYVQLSVFTFGTDEGLHHQFQNRKIIVKPKCPMNSFKDRQTNQYTRMLTKIIPFFHCRHSKHCHNVFV
ncbi:uncharacterized protein LOC128205079 isoform X1 [Mya arenaria]|uniref:uncharacterized protein LOC128205079 isoform X1 n=1 Tax=Mya arenaria TaxID=6604 RepID=UPI0022E51007|nr:uncharacterized protein LOC128205079 isoform X1 [Mya arenaria]